MKLPVAFTHYAQSFSATLHAGTARRSTTAAALRKSRIMSIVLNAWNHHLLLKRMILMTMLKCSWIHETAPMLPWSE